MERAILGCRAYGGGTVYFPPADSRVVIRTGASVLEEGTGVVFVEVKPVDCPAHREWIAANDLEAV